MKGLDEIYRIMQGFELSVQYLEERRVYTDILYTLILPSLHVNNLPDRKDLCGWRYHSRMVNQAPISGNACRLSGSSRILCKVKEAWVKKATNSEIMFMPYQRLPFKNSGRPREEDSFISQGPCMP